MALRGAVIRLLLAVCATLLVAVVAPYPAQALISYSVTTTADAGAPGAPGTLRWAFEQAATDADDSEISFAVSGVIKLQGEALVEQTADEVLSIDASGSGIVLDGSQLAVGSGIRVSNGTLVIEALTLVDFKDFGIWLANAHASRIGPLACGASPSVTITRSLLSGILITGFLATDNTVRCSSITLNGDDGITIINGAYDNYVENNFRLSLNTTNGVKITGGAYNNVVRGNLEVNGNTQSGVLVAQNAFGNQILGNVLRFNFFDGVQIDGFNTVNNVVDDYGGTPNQISNNYRHGLSISNGASDNLVTGTTQVTSNQLVGVQIYISADRNVVFGSTISNNGDFGIQIESSTDVIVGADGRGNSITNNGRAGVYIDGSSDQTTILDNVITGNSDHQLRVEGNAANNTVIGRIGEGNTIGSCPSLPNANNLWAGIRFNSAALADVGYNTVQSCITGVLSLNSSSLQVHDNVLQNNSYGARIAQSTFGVLGPNNTIQSNTFGVYFNLGGGGDVLSNTISNNQRSGLFVDAGATSGSQDVTGNTFTSNGVGGSISNVNFHPHSPYNNANLLPQEEYYWGAVQFNNTSGTAWNVGPANRFTNNRIGVVVHLSSPRIVNNGAGSDTNPLNGFNGNASSFAGVRITGNASTQPLVQGNRFQGGAYGVNVFGGGGVLDANTFAGHAQAGIYAELNPRLLDAFFYVSSSTFSYSIANDVDLNPSDDHPATPSITNNIFDTNTGPGIYSLESKPANFAAIVAGTSGNVFAGTNRFFEQAWYGLIGATYSDGGFTRSKSCVLNGSALAADIDGMCPKSWVDQLNGLVPDDPGSVALARRLYTTWLKIPEAIIESSGALILRDVTAPHAPQVVTDTGTYTGAYTWDGNTGNESQVAPYDPPFAGTNQSGRFQVAWVRVPRVPTVEFRENGVATSTYNVDSAATELTLFVDDVSADTSGAIIDSISVRITTDTGEFEVYNLSESFASSHQFERILPVVLSESTIANNGVIDVDVGTMVWVEYDSPEPYLTNSILRSVLITGPSGSAIYVVPCASYTGLNPCTSYYSLNPQEPFTKTLLNAPSRIQLHDMSRNASATEAESFEADVRLFNASNPLQYQNITLRMTETGLSSGIFVSEVWIADPESSYPATSPTMALMFGHRGDRLDVSYQDPDDPEDFSARSVSLTTFSPGTLRLLNIDGLVESTFLPQELILVELADESMDAFSRQKDQVISGAYTSGSSHSAIIRGAGLVLYSEDSLGNVLDVESLTLTETGIASAVFRGLVASHSEQGRNASLYVPNGVLFAPVGAKVKAFYRDILAYDPNIPISLDESTAVASVIAEADTRRLSMTDALYSPQFQLFVRERLEPRYFEFDATDASGLYKDGIVLVRVLKGFQVDDVESPDMQDEVTTPGRYRGQVIQTSSETSNAGALGQNDRLNGGIGQTVAARWYDPAQSEHWSSGVFCPTSLSYLKLFDSNERKYDPRNELQEVIEEAKLRVVVADPNKDIDPGKQESVIIEAKTENDTEVLAALETTTNSGIFVAAVAQQLSDSGLEKNNGQLETHVGDILTFSYVDDTPTASGGELCGFTDQSTRTYVVGSAERRSFIYFLDSQHEPVRELQWPGQYFVRLINGGGNRDPDVRESVYVDLAAAGKVPGSDQWRNTKLLETEANSGAFEGIVILTNKRVRSELAPTAQLADAATQTVFGAADIELGDRMYASFVNPREPTDKVRKVIPLAFEKLIIHWYLSQTVASLGDLVVNRMEIENPNPVVVPAGVMLDLSMVAELRLHPDSLRLPAGLYIKPAPGRSYSVELPQIGKGERLKFSWADAVPPGVTVGTKQGTALARRGERALSDTKRVELRIEQDPLFEQGQLVGRVFVDPNANDWKETYEPGWSGAVLYTNLGHKITTDRHGRFHVGPLPPGNVTVKLDPSSVPVGTVIDPPVQTAQIWPGEMSKLNFALRPSGETVPGDWVEMPFMNAEVSNVKAGYLLNGSLNTALELGGQPVPWRWVDVRAVQVRQGTLVMREVSLKPLSFEYDIPDPALAVTAVVELELPGEGLLFQRSFLPGQAAGGTMVYPDTQKLMDYEGREVIYRLRVEYADGVRARTSDIAFRILKELPTERLATASNFDVGSRSVEPLTIKNLKAAAELLRSYPNARVIIEGHTDNTGPRELNIRLSKLRAEKGKEYMAVVEEIDPDRVIARGYGPDYPLASNDTEAGRTINRRVVVTVEGLPSQNAKTYEPLITAGERSIKLSSDKEPIKTLVQPGLSLSMRDSQGREVVVPFRDPGVRVQIPASTVAREPDYPIRVTVTAEAGAIISGSLDATHAVTGTTEYPLFVRKQKKIRVAVALPNGLVYETLANVDLTPLDKKQDRKKLDPGRYLKAEMPVAKVKLPRAGISFYAWAPTGTVLEVNPGSALAVTEGVYLVQTGRLPADIVDIQLTTTTADNLRVAINRTYPVRNSSLVYVGSAEGRGEIYRQSVGTAEFPDGRGYEVDVEGAALVHGNLNENADMTMWVGGARSDVYSLRDNWLSLNAPTLNPSTLALRERAAYMTYADDATVESVIAPLGPAYIHMRYKSSEVGWGVFRSRRLKFSLLDDSDLHAGAWGWLSSAPVQAQRDGPFMVEYSTEGTWSTGVGGFVTPKLHGRATDNFTTVGTSLYYLRNQRVVPGSEQVELGVLDARTGLLRDRRILLRGEDYRIDYVLGQIILLKAIAFLVGTDSLILDNAAGRDTPLLSVRYDHEVVLGDTQWSHRELASQRLWDLVEVQGYYQEQRDAAEVARRGGSRLEIGDPETALGSFEYGRVLGGSQTDWLSEDGGLSWYSRTISDSVGQGADAYRGQLHVQRGMVRYSADGIFYDNGYQRATGTFNTQRFTLLNEVGVYPADVTDGFWNAQWGRPSIVGRHAMLRNGTKGEFDQIEEGQLGYAFDPWDTRLGLENRHGPTDALSILAGELGYRFWRMRLYGRHQHMVREITNSSGLEQWISSLGTQVMWTDKLSTDLRASYGALTWGGTLGFGYNNISGQTISVYSNYMQRHEDGAQAWGVGTSGEQPIGAATRLSASQRYDIGDTQKGWFSGVGAQTSLLSPLTVSARFEKGRMHSLLDDRATVDRMVVGAGLSLGWQALKLSTNGEMRDDKTDTVGSNVQPMDQRQYNTWSNGRYNWNEEIYSVATAGYSLTISQATSERLARNFETGVGLGYRPVKKNFVDTLGMLRYLDTTFPRAQVGPTGVRSARSVILSEDTYFQFPFRLFVRHKGAVKRSRLHYSGDPVALTTMLNVAGLGWRFWGPLYAYSEYRLLWQFETGVVQHGPTAELGVNPQDWIYFGIGYNFSTIDDALYNVDPFDREGIYARLRIEF